MTNPSSSLSQDRAKIPFKKKDEITEQTYCNVYFCKSMRQRRQLARQMAKFEKELDVLRFVKIMKMIKISLRTVLARPPSSK